MDTPPQQQQPKPQNGSGLKKIFVQRDYSHGTSIHFQTKFPSELKDKERNGGITNQAYTHFIETLNTMYCEAETMSSKICCESCFACLTAYLTYLCFESYFDKCLKRISKYIEEQNDTVFKPCGLFVVDPLERGLRVIEIVMNEQYPQSS